MDVLQYLSGKSSIARSIYDSVAYYSWDMAIRVQIWGFNSIPRGSIESGMFFAHPFIVPLAGVFYKFRLDKMGDKMIKHAVKAAKDGIEKIDKGLEGKL